MKLNRQVNPGLKALPPRPPRRFSLPMNLDKMRAGKLWAGRFSLQFSCPQSSCPSSGSWRGHQRVHREGVALVATLIMLSLVTFMVVAFLGVARRERRAIEASTTAGEARVASDAASWPACSSAATSGTTA
jgi:hypothetical protein